MFSHDYFVKVAQEFSYPLLLSLPLPMRHDVKDELMVIV